METAMNATRSFCTIALSAITMAMAIGCGNTEVSELDISPDITTLGKGDTTQFKVIARYADGTTEDISSNPLTKWNTSDVENATVNDSGLVTAVDEGAVSIEAEFDGVTASEDFLVTP